MVVLSIGLRARIVSADDRETSGYASLVRLIRPARDPLLAGRLSCS